MQVVEVLPEGEDRAWITLGDGLTRLVGFRSLMLESSHQALRLPKLFRRLRLISDGTHVVWPDGTLLDASSVREAPYGPLPLHLLALVPASQRYRPVAALLRTCEPPVSDYLDVRPPQVIASRLGLKSTELDRILTGHHPAGSEQVTARLSDLTLLLSTLVPDDLLHGLLRRPWPRLQPQGSPSLLKNSALDSLFDGRIDLIEAPLVHLLLPKPEHLMKEMPVIQSRHEAGQCAEATEQRSRK